MALREKTLKGEQLMLFVGGHVIPLSTSCKLSISQQIESDATKDDGIYDHNVSGIHSWTATNDSKLYAAALKDDAGTRLNVGDSVAVIIGIPSNWDAEGVEETTNGWTAPSGLYWAGQGIIESLDLSADVGSAATGSISIKSTGPLNQLGIVQVEAMVAGDGTLTFSDANGNVVEELHCDIGLSSASKTLWFVSGQSLSVKATEGETSSFGSWDIKKGTAATTHPSQNPYELVIGTTTPIIVTAHFTPNS